MTGNYIKLYTDTFDQRHDLIQILEKLKYQFYRPSNTHNFKLRSSSTDVATNRNSPCYHQPMTQAIITPIPTEQQASTDQEYFHQSLETTIAPHTSSSDSLITIPRTLNFTPSILLFSTDNKKRTPILFDMGRKAF
ncbi:hypothetical protein TNIN_392691 [Trichonephila inaurata madagascariensis]|uniref:Uncharacterized protein n=1 Tax=Trichonephila inaurata madagascariensis TaxID=2747483 RepID=A0A8X6YFU6_9ARAC|nr:hypothetical protein TNIN_392691 [Trichonephila inaurata madagascariensis]